jgi:hypothetical protein
LKYFSDVLRYGSLLNKRTNERTKKMTTTATATDYWMATATAVTTTNAFPVPHTPLTKEQRDEKSCDYQFGLCDTCYAGLDDRGEVNFHYRADGTVETLCDACHNYYIDAPCYATED